MLRVAPFLLALALLVPASPAAGATRTLTRFADDGPVLAGSKVLYGYGLTRGEGGSPLGAELRSVPVAGAPRSSLVHRFTTYDKDTFENRLVSIDADGSRWAAVREAVELQGDGPDTIDIPQGADLVAGTIGGRVTRLASSLGRKRCARPSFDAPLSVAVVDGGTAAAVAPRSCGGSSIVVRTGRKTVRLAGSGPVRGAGRYLAFVRGSAVVVYDVAARREAYRITGEAGEKVGGFDPQTDGKVAVKWEGPDFDAARLAWYSRSENRAHDLALTGPELGGGRFVSLAADTVILPLETRPDDFTITALTLSGARTPVQRVRDLGPPVGLDFDGTRIAWIDEVGLRVAPKP